ncbi:hypothetical protein FRX31_027081 [Thalictrum thalictroides]|uniref:Uncharacterized protein n=1 Tax=Thalictrum thalictroides TaxID=46969 RepID=A0A7J6VGB8_THATH|nr:hypothetical protein FRX31_027081 [Thalictrum thalictroides]
MRGLAMKKFSIGFEKANVQNDKAKADERRAENDGGEVKVERDEESEAERRAENDGGEVKVERDEESEAEESRNRI